MIQKLNTEVNVLNKRNLATSSNIIFKSSLLNDEDYFIQSVSLPGLTFTAPELGVPSPFNTSVIVHPDTILYDPVDLVFLCDENLDIWKSIINKAKNLTTFDEDITEGNSWIFIKDSNGNTRKTIVLKNSVIISVSGLDYSSADNDDILTFSVSVNYTEFQIEDTSEEPELRR